MITFIHYALQVIICSAIFNLYYVIVLRNKKFNRYNRFYLLATTLLSIVLPLVKISLPMSTIPKENVSTWQTGIQVMVQANTEFTEVVQTQTAYITNYNWWMIFYVAIAGFLLFKLVRAVLKVGYQIKNHEFTKINKAWFTNTNLQGTPFSFFNYIFWNKEQSLETPIAQKMLAHELAHVQQKHSLDILFLKLLTCVFWFNPFNWYVQKELLTIHEFLADEQAVQQGNAPELAAMLLQTIQPTLFSLVHPFFVTSIKRRINMITKNKPTSLSYVKRLLPLPLMALAFTLFAFTYKATKSTELSKEQIAVINAEHGGAEKVTLRNNLKEKDIAFKKTKSIELSKEYIVVIDAGHGGADEGALGNNLKEKDIALQLALAVQKANTNPKVKLVFTRTEDVFQNVKEKAIFANEANPNLLVSLHANDSPPNADPKSGIEVYVSAKNKYYELSKQLGFNINKEFEGYALKPLGIKERPVGIYVLQAVNCPAVLFEAGFISNKQDATFLKNENNVKIIAEKILNGIYNYLQLVENNNTELVQADSVPTVQKRRFGFAQLPGNKIENNPNGATQEQLNEYASIVNEYSLNGKLQTKKIFEMPEAKKKD